MREQRELSRLSVFSALNPLTALWYPVGGGGQNVVAKHGGIVENGSEYLVKHISSTLILRYLFIHLSIFLRMGTLRVYIKRLIYVNTFLSGIQCLFTLESCSSLKSG